MNVQETLITLDDGVVCLLVWDGASLPVEFFGADPIRQRRESLT